MKPMCAGTRGEIDARTKKHRMHSEAFQVEHSLRAPAVGYRIAVGRTAVFCVPDLIRIHDRHAGLSGIDICIGNGASLKRPLIRRRGGHLIGLASVAAQLAWCAREGIRRAIFAFVDPRLFPNLNSAASAQ